RARRTYAPIRPLLDLLRTALHDPVPPRSSMDAERNLLFGELALRNELIAAAQLAAAQAAVAARPHLVLADVLVERGWLTPEDRLHLEYLVERRLRLQTRSCPASVDAGGDLTPPPPVEMPGDVPAFAGTLTPAPFGAELYPPDCPGTTARYALLHLHAAGGLGRVWRTRDDTLGREVALKELRPEAVRHAALRARFLEEARITGRLEHPGIVPVYELAWRGEPARPFYTMRFVKG